jgi:hypothetical protein
LNLAGWKKMAWIFVGGSQRSGTSVMQQLLCQSPLTNPYIFEASYLRQLVTVYQDASLSFRGNYSSYFKDETDLREFNSLLVRAFLEHTRQHLNNCTHLVLKEPHLTRVWPSLYELVPEAVFLLMIRDPRDVIASMIEVGERQKAAGQSYLFTERNIQKLCDHFIGFYAPALNVTDPGFRERMAIVLYENLATNPAQALKQISGFTGIDFEAIDPAASPESGLVSYQQITSSKHFSPWATELSGQKVSESKVGNYRNVLTPSEIAQVEEHCEPFFDWFNYSRRAA